MKDKETKKKLTKKEIKKLRALREKQFDNREMIKK